jgi:glycosyltransferase involved in cell wall biosynthesis
MLRKSAMTFDTVSAISKGVIRKLNIHRNISLLPLGADAISNTDKEFTAIHLLYIGTMTNRHIPQTIEGLSMYLTKNPHAKITYDIVGGDNGEGELKHVEEVVKKYGLGEYIRVHGPKPHNELKPFLDNCNVGISYVPITDYFQYQPPTKTYEYAFSGLATIATATFANSEIINDTNGIIIKDTPEDFCQGLEKIKSLKFNSKLIRQSVSKFSWKNIVSKYLVPIIEQQSV